MRTLKAFFSKLQNFRQTLQEKRAKREPNARVVKAVAFMNRYSILFHGILSCLLCFVIECISRRSFFSACSFVGGHTLAYFYNAFIIFVSLSLVYLFKHRALFRVLSSVPAHKYWSLS